MRTAILLAMTPAILAGCSVPVSTAPVATKTTTVTVTERPATDSPTSAPPASPATQTVMNTDGMYVVGKDIQAGTYKSAPTLRNGYPFCTWKRLSDFSGTSESTIAIDNQAGQTIVTIQPSDVAFERQSCQPWERID